MNIILNMNITKWTNKVHSNMPTKIKFQKPKGKNNICNLKINKHTFHREENSSQHICGKWILFSNQMSLHYLYNILTGVINIHY